MTWPLPLKGTVATRGQEIFLDNSLGKCNLCHRNAGANADVGGQDLGNANFNTGVENMEDQPIDQIGERVSPDDGFGVPGGGTFNTPPLVEAADTGPFFHNNSIDTIEGAVAFYNGAHSISGRSLASTDPSGVGIKLEATQLVPVAMAVHRCGCRRIVPKRYRWWSSRGELRGVDLKNWFGQRRKPIVVRFHFGGWKHYCGFLYLHDALCVVSIRGL